MTPLRAGGPLAPRAARVGLSIGMDDDDPSILIAVGPDGKIKRIPIGEGAPTDQRFDDDG